MASSEVKSQGIRKISSKLPRISIAEKLGGHRDSQNNKAGKQGGPGGGAPGGASNRKSILLNTRHSVFFGGKKHSHAVSLPGGSSYGSSFSVSEHVITVPDYLDPQPSFFKDHMADDMIIEPIDPMADTEEEEEPAPEIFAEEYDDDFDYESLYAEEPAGTGDDFDDFIADSSVQDSQAQLGAFGEEEGGNDEEEEDEEEGEELEEFPDDGNLQECDDRSDDEIAHERMLQELYQTAFSDIMALRISRDAEAEAPSITQKSLDEYFLDREEEKISKHQEEFMGWFYTDGSEILHRRKMLSCLDSILIKERIKYKAIKGGFTERWEEGQAKQVVIDGALVKFDSYYRETLGKKNRAIQQTAHEIAQKLDKIREVNRCKKELSCLSRIQEQCEKRLGRFRIFEKYLVRVRDTSRGEFSDIRDIIDRYGVLSQARNALISRDLRNQDKIERAQNSLKRTMDLRSNELLVYNNYLSELRVYRDNIHEEILQLEEMLLHIKTTAANRTLLIGQIKMAINNLYLGLCKQLGRAGKIPPEDTLRQLNYVKSSMKEIIKLSRDVKQMLKSAAQAAERDKKEKERLERENKKRKFRYAKDHNKGNDYLALFGFKQPE